MCIHMYRRKKPSKHVSLQLYKLNPRCFVPMFTTNPIYGGGAMERERERRCCFRRCPSVHILPLPMMWSPTYSNCIHITYCQFEICYQLTRADADISSLLNNGVNWHRLLMTSFRWTIDAGTYVRISEYIHSLTCVVIFIYIYILKLYWFWFSYTGDVANVQNLAWHDALIFCLPFHFALDLSLTSARSHIAYRMWKDFGKKMMVQLCLHSIS